MSIGLAVLDLFTSVSRSVLSIVAPMVQWTSHLTSMWRDTGSNPTWDMEFFFHFSDVSRKLPVSLYTFLL